MFKCHFNFNHFDQGAFGTVFLVKRKESGRARAIKAISKSEMFKNQEYANEIQILREIKESLMFPKLLFVTEGKNFLYMGFEFCIGGTLDILWPRYENIPFLTQQ